MEPRKSLKTVFPLPKQGKRYIPFKDRKDSKLQVREKLNEYMKQKFNTTKDQSLSPNKSCNGSQEIKEIAHFQNLQRLEKIETQNSLESKTTLKQLSIKTTQD